MVNVFTVTSAEPQAMTDRERFALIARLLEEYLLTLVPSVDDDEDCVPSEPLPPLLVQAKRRAVEGAQEKKMKLKYRVMVGDDVVSQHHYFHSAELARLKTWQENKSSAPRVEKREEDGTYSEVGK